LAAAPERIGIEERILSDGTTYIPLNEDQAREAITQLLDAEIDAFAVCLLHSYINPDHEHALADLIHNMSNGDRPVSISSEIAAEFKEYERTSTTVANAYVQPVITDYQNRLESELANKGFAHNLYIMLSEGGVATTEITAKHAIRMVESGPAAGVLAGTWMGGRIGEHRLVSLDVGGTTAKACLVRDGAPTRTNLFEVARTKRFMKGSGIPVSVPSIEMVEVGAGGGSIARVDDAGILRVGPNSAGSNPGPACYGLGGQLPTVTDANLILGHLSAEGFAGGSQQLDFKAAQTAIGTIAGALDVSLEEAAAAIVEIATENMVGAVRVHLAEQGQDPRSCSLLASGGGGPLHGPTVARKMHMKRVICPPRAGVFSALGLLVAPPSFNLGRTMITRMDCADWRKINDLLREMEKSGRKLLEGFDIDPTTVRIARSVDMRRVGQTHSVTVPIPGHELSADDRQVVEEAFDAVCVRLYGHNLGDAPAEALTWRVSLYGPEPDLSVSNPKVTSATHQPSQRDCYFRGHGYLQASVHVREALQPGAGGQGPALIEERDSTVLVGPRDSFHIDDVGNLIVEIGG